MNGIKDFSKAELKEIALLYIEKDQNYKKISSLYDISEGTFYAILRKVIVEHIIDLDTVAKFKERSEVSELFFFGKNAKNITKNHYYNTLVERNHYLLPKTKSKPLFREFLYKDDSISKIKFCNERFIDLELLDKTILDCIVNNIISGRDYNLFILKFAELSKKYASIFRELTYLRELNINIDPIKLYDYILDHKYSLNASDFLNSK